MNKHDKILTEKNCALLVVDIQERILPAMFESESFLTNTLKLIKGIKVLQIPIFFTEQYPKGLGKTVKVISDELEGISAFEKMTFSCAGAENLFDELKKKSIIKVILVGIESHVCILQTALDLIVNGFEVFLPADAVTSRKKQDCEVALKRMEKHGVEITLTESVLFEMLNVCGTEQFKQISKIVK